MNLSPESLLPQIAALTNIQRQPVPPLRRENVDGIEKAYGNNLNIVSEAHNLNRTLGKKDARKLIKEKGLGEKVAGSILDILSVATADKSLTGLNFNEADVMGMAKEFPPLLSDLQLGPAIRELVRDEYREDLTLPVDSDEEMNTKWQDTVDAITALQNKDTLTPEERRQGAQQVLKLYVLISSPKGFNDEITTGEGDTQQTIKPSTEATGLLIKHRLGDELHALLREETPGETEEETAQTIPVELYWIDLAEARENGITEGKAEAAKELHPLLVQAEKTHQAQMKALEIRAKKAEAELAKAREARPPGETTDISTITSALKDALAGVAEGKNINTLSGPTQTLLFNLLGQDGMATLSQIATRPSLGQEQANKLTEFDALTQALKIAISGGQVPANLTQKLSGDSQKIIAGLAERNKQTDAATNRPTGTDTDNGNNGEKYIATYETDEQWENLAAQKYRLTGEDGNAHVLTLAQIIEAVDNPESPFGISGTIAVLKSIGLNTAALNKLGSPRSPENRENWRKALEKIGRQINRGVHPDTNPRTNSNPDLQTVAKFASSFANLVRDKHLALSSGLYLDLLKK